MDYEKIYNNLMSDRKSRALVKEMGYEMHHIIPTSFGGDNKKSNIVKLTYREHYIAHKLLTKVYKDKCKDRYVKSVYALWVIGNSKSDVRNSRGYERVKKLFKTVTLPELRRKRGQPEDVFRTYHCRSARTNILQIFLESSKGGLYGKILHKHYFVEGKTPRRLKPFIEFCAVIYKMGFDKMSLSVDMRSFYTKTKGLLHREENHVGVHYRLSDEFKELCDAITLPPSFAILERAMVKGKPISGCRAAISEWNAKHPKKLIYAEIAEGCVCFHPLNNWDITGVPFLTEPLDYLKIAEFRRTIEKVELKIS